MKLLTIAEIKQLRNKEPIESFGGTIETVYPQKTGTGQYGQWWLQNMIVSDSTGKVQVTWGGEDDLKSLQGQQRIFESKLTEKHGYLGIKLDVRKVNGKTYEGIKLTESCKIKPVSNGQAVESPKQAEPVKTAENKPNEDTGVLETRRHLMQSVNLYTLCLDAAEKVILPHYKAMWLDKPNMPPELFQAAVASLYIEASHKRTIDVVNWWSFIDKMPEHPIK